MNTDAVREYTGDDELDAIIHDLTSRLEPTFRKIVREETSWKLNDTFGPATWVSDPTVALPPELTDEHDAHRVIAHELGHVIHGHAGYDVQRGYPDAVEEGGYTADALARDDVSEYELERRHEPTEGVPFQVEFAVAEADLTYRSVQGALHAGHIPSDAIPRPYAAVSGAEMFAELSRLALIEDEETPGGFDVLLAA